MYVPKVLSIICTRVIMVSSWDSNLNSWVRFPTLATYQGRRNRGLRGGYGPPTFPRIFDHLSSLILLELHIIPKYHYSSLVAVLRFICL